MRFMKSRREDIKRRRALLCGPCDRVEGARSSVVIRPVRLVKPRQPFRSFTRCKMVAIPVPGLHTGVGKTRADQMGL